NAQMNAKTPRRQGTTKESEFRLSWRLGVLAFILLSGCSTNLYQRWADQQVDQIVRKREEVTLGYTPQVVAPVEANSKPTTQAYAKVPATIKPPPTTS